jgi:Na+-driven multidrug efflux pump
MINIKTILHRHDIREFAAEGWSVAWPMTLIMFFEFLIGLTDIYVAGRVGKEVQAAYGFVIQLYFVFIIVGNALSMGAFVSGLPARYSPTGCFAVNVG